MGVKWYFIVILIFIPLIIHYIEHFIMYLLIAYFWKSESEVAQSCPTLWDPMDCSLPDSSLHGILQARILEWVAISFSRGSSWPRDQTQVSCTAGRHFTLWATREAKTYGMQQKQF